MARLEIVGSIEINKPCNCWSTHLGFEGDFWGLEGIVADEVDVHGERPSGVGAAVGAVDDHLPVEEVRHRRRAGPAERRRLDPYQAELPPDPSSERLQSHPPSLVATSTGETLFVQAKAALVLDTDVLALERD